MPVRRPPARSGTRKEVADSGRHVGDLVGVRQGHHAEVVGTDPVECRALHHEHLLLLQEVEHHAFVVHDPEAARVDLREQVERALRPGAGDAGNGVDRLVQGVALHRQAAAGGGELMDALSAAERGFDGELRRHVGAQPHRRQYAEPLDVVARPLPGAAEHQPAGSEAGHAVGLGEAVEGADEDVVGECSQRRVLHAVVEDLVVDLVGEQDQVVLAGERHDPLQAVARIHRPGRVVGIDHHDGAGAGGDLGGDVVKVRCPAGLLVAQVVHRVSAGQVGRRGPQRVVGGGNQHLVAVVEQTLQGHGDQLADPVAEVDVLDLHMRHAERLVVPHDRLARAEQPLRVAVALPRGDVRHHVAQDLRGRLEAPLGRIADVQLRDLKPLIFQPPRGGQNGTAYVVTYVLQLVRLHDLHNSDPSGPWKAK